MKISKDDLAVKMEIPGAIVRVKTEFGEAGGSGMNGEWFTLSAGVDTTPLFQGLEGNQCQCPHWGYVLNGKITTTDSKGNRETVTSKDLFYWPPGHNLLVEEDADLIMFSPQVEHMHVIDHLIKATS